MARMKNVYWMYIAGLLIIPVLLIVIFEVNITPNSIFGDDVDLSINLDLDKFDVLLLILVFGLFGMLIWNIFNKKVLRVRHGYQKKKAKSLKLKGKQQKSEIQKLKPIKKKKKLIKKKKK